MIDNKGEREVDQEGLKEISDTMLMGIDFHYLKKEMHEMYINKYNRPFRPCLASIQEYMDLYIEVYSNSSNN